MSELLRIPLSSIRENPVALRAVNRQDADYLSFRDSVRTVGVLNPIVVREIPSSEGEKLYGIIEGLHRYTASLDSGLPDIPAHVMNMSDADVMEAQLIGNVHKIETKPVEYSKQLQRILAANPLLTLTQLAAKLNKSSQWLSERLGILKLDPKIASLVDEGRINLVNAYALAKLPVEEQGNFVDRAITMPPGEFTPTVLGRKKELDAAKRQGRDAAPAEFTPVPHIQKLAELKNEMEKPTVGPALINELAVTSAVDGFALGVRWALHMDPFSIKVAKEKDDARKAQAQQKREEAAKERAQKKANDAAVAAATVAN